MLLIQGCKSVSSIGGGIILRFLIPGSCYAQTHVFPTPFLQIFLDDLFFARQPNLFSHVSCKNPLKRINVYILHLPYPPPPKYFSLPAWWENIRELPAMGKNQNYWGGWRSNIRGGCIPPSPWDLQPCFYCVHLHVFNLYSISHKFLNLTHFHTKTSKKSSTGYSYTERESKDESVITS